MSSPSDTDLAKLEIQQIDDATHVQIIDQKTLLLVAQHKTRSLEAEMMVTSFAGNTATYPIWQIDKVGEVCWHNNVYGRLYQRIFEKAPSAVWPLFDIETQTSDPLQSRRISIFSGIDEKQLWYDISCVEADAGIICHAIDINAVIDAEIAQRNFVQTLAKTFAHLSAELVIFDRNGQLTLFNPSFVFLSKLPVEFLSTRPDLLLFFNRLRDHQIMPEPKNYRSWREELANVIKATTDRSYRENWSLGTRQDYRATVRLC